MHALLSHAVSKVDSMTKYPSIETYHKLVGSGVLSEEVTVDWTDTTVLSEEKVDGCNARIIATPGGEWIIGSRYELLTASGDMIYNRKDGIVDALRPIAERIARDPMDWITVYYLEVFGGNIGKACKQYTGDGTVGWSLFDVVQIGVDDLEDMVTWTPEQIAGWRDGGGQQFVNHQLMHTYALDLGLKAVPHLGMSSADALPTSVEDTLTWMRHVLPRTKSSLGGGGGKPEGIILRDSNRSQIRKLRFESYERTLRLREQAL